ncbi:hypothetical protein CEUSTIGMA_g11843.t1 [Chlamydomonas eustigma]|uniref:Uncharacterized protein n=1 Tax=Chlamydomonas eustigma TaxID=1157962 RepID=A0A250XND3_9CHLO|nr:hypothetical protein CEUSTIGMA_g11843.t1 [Chlamydomonas eustigma]|eukprot:GAX84422.1 hypothetical protein CEUSTIGMA_g11843.t1 [Chlamydomonas eustigma]
MYRGHATLGGMSKQASKRPRQLCHTECSSTVVDISDWTRLASRYKSQDEMRETVIKKCRDMQKLSKNAIFSMHRGDMNTASAQILQAETIAKELLPVISEAQSLRQGSFTNACEEYAEARIFEVKHRLKAASCLLRGPMPLCCNMIKSMTSSSVKHNVLWPF